MGRCLIFLLFHGILVLDSVKAKNDSGKISVKEDEVKYRWSAWSEFTVCSRSCGIGLKYQHRDCYSIGKETTKVSSKFCDGEAKNYQTCNIQPCQEPLTDFLDLQCSFFNGRDESGVYHSWRGVNLSDETKKCALICSTIDASNISRQFSNKVVDGTWCGDSNVCVDGKCRPVGCDGVLESNKTTDKCGQCNGNNTTCDDITGRVKRRVAKGYTELLEFPQGAKNIKVSEKPRSRVILVMKDREGIFFFPAASSKTTNITMASREVAGTLFTYIKNNQSGNVMEKIEADGPINKTVTIMGFSRQEKATVALWYSYTNVSHTDPTSANKNITIEPYYPWQTLLHHSILETVDAREATKIAEDLDAKKKSGKPDPRGPTTETEKRGNIDSSTHMTSNNTYDFKETGSLNKQKAEPPEDQKNQKESKPKNNEEQPRPLVRMRKTPNDNNDQKNSENTIGTTRKSSFSTQRKKDSGRKKENKETARESPKKKETVKPRKTKKKPSKNYLKLEKPRLKIRTSPSRESSQKETVSANTLSPSKSYQNKEMTKSDTLKGKSPLDKDKRKPKLKVQRKDFRKSKGSYKQDKGKTKDERGDKIRRKDRSGSKTMIEPDTSTPKPINLRLKPRINIKGKPKFMGDLKKSKRRQQHSISGARHVSGGSSTQAKEELSIKVATKTQPESLNKFDFNRRSRKTSDVKFEWRGNQITPCSSTCEPGVRVTFFSCYRISTNHKVDDVYCKAEDKPDISYHTCSRHSCPPRWVAGEWGSCSLTCGEGVQQRQVKCWQILAPGFDSSVHDYLCNDTKPVHVRECKAIFLCGPVWEFSQWGKCSVDCGYGWQERSVRCNGEKESDCLTRKPVEKQACIQKPCSNYWYAATWSKCSGTCGVKHRKIFCRNKAGHIVDEGQCDSSKKPLSVHICSHGIGRCNHAWVPQEWRRCPVECGEGNSTRKIVCGLLKEGHFKVEPDTYCHHLSRPPDKTLCSAKPCGPKWYITEWGECSEPCGDDAIRMRDVKCYHGDQISENCFIEHQPDDTEKCLLPSCPSKTDDVCKDDKRVGCEFLVKPKLCQRPYYRQVCCQTCHRFGF